MQEVQEVQEVQAVAGVNALKAAQGGHCGIKSNFALRECQALRPGVGNTQMT